MIWTLAARQRSTVRAWTCCDYKYRLLRPVDSWREGGVWSGWACGEPGSHRELGQGFGWAELLNDLGCAGSGNQG